MENPDDMPRCLLEAIPIEILPGVLIFVDPCSLLRVAMTNKWARSRVSVHCAELPYAASLIRSARAHLVRTLVGLHSGCVGWIGQQLESAAVSHTDRFLDMVANFDPGVVLASTKSTKRALAAAGAATASDPDTWSWKMAIRALFPIAASYGRSWPDSSFAVKVCAHAIHSMELLALFAPDPCASLERLATGAKNDVGTAVAAVLHAMIRTATPTNAAMMSHYAESLVSHAIGRVKTRSEFALMIACLALLGRVGTPRLVSAPGQLYSSVCVRRTSRRGHPLDMDLFARLLGIELETRLCSRFEESFTCAGHPRVPGQQPRVANILSALFAETAAASTRHMESGQVPPADFGRVDRGGPQNSIARPSADSTSSAAAQASADTRPDPDAAAPDEEEIKTTLAPEDVVAMVNAVARQSGVDPSALLHRFLTQPPSAVGVAEDDPDADDNPDDDPAPDGDLNGDPDGEPESKNEESDSSMPELEDIHAANSPDDYTGLIDAGVGTESHLRDSAPDGVRTMDDAALFLNDFIGQLAAAEPSPP